MMLPVRFFLVVTIGFLAYRAASSTPTQSSFVSAQAERAWEFPRDHGSHNEFQTEWWYFTATMYDDTAVPFRDPPRYGVQLVFFRRAGSPNGAQLYLAHSAVTDLKAKEFLFDSRAADGSALVAGADQRILSLWNGSWSADQFGSKFALKFRVKNRYEARLMFEPVSAPIFHGVKGLSAKGSCEGSCHSFYYSFTGAAITGTVIDDGRVVPVRGVGWFDHEFMTNALGDGQVGWDWLSLMRGNEESLMIFQVRHTDPAKRFRAGTLRRNGEDVQLSGEEIEMDPGRTWKSAKSNAIYPVEWRVRVPKYGIDTKVVARVDGCEIAAPPQSGVPTYWEGPVRGKSEDEIGYLEMTGYDQVVGASF